MPSKMVGTKCTVTLLGRCGLQYEAGGRSLYVDGEMMTGRVDFAVYTKTIQIWEASGIRIRPEEKTEIIENIAATLTEHRVVARFEET